MKCCICEREFEGLGNSPYGAEDFVKRGFGYEERCCDTCNVKYVIPGRLARLKRVSKENK